MKSEVNPLFIKTSLKTAFSIPVSFDLQHYLDMPPRYPECFHTHLQNSVEILLIVDGTLIATLKSREYTLHAGDLLVCSPLNRHAGRVPGAHDSTSYYCFTFDHAYFMRVLPAFAVERLRLIMSGKASFTPCIDASDPEGDAIREIIRKLPEGSDAYAESAMCVGALDVLCRLLTGYFCEEPQDTELNFQFIHQTADYINSHYAEPITTASISSAFSYSEGYFCRRFRECFGVTCIDYLTHYRIERAIDMYAPYKQLTEIASRVGFADYTSFCRAFQKVMHTTPTKYFKR